jgi:uncharacterized protein YbcC (UPF0753/DUF2309 family)
LSRENIHAACSRATDSITPGWPLDQAVAVNPHWRRIGAPIHRVASRLALLGGFRVFPQRPYIRDRWQAGRITRADLDAAIAQSEAPQPPVASALIAALDEAPLPAMPLVVDVLDDDQHRTRRLPWRGAITFQLSQVCAAYFDQDQAHWLPLANAGLYRFWADTLHHDKGVSTVMGLPRLPRVLHELPPDAEQAVDWALARLGLPEAAIEPYLETLLLSINGWASWCSWLKYQHEGHHRHDTHLDELLAMRLAWEALLLACHPARVEQAVTDLAAAWNVLPRRLTEAEMRARVDEVWQVALEHGYQRELAGKLVSLAPPTATKPAPEGGVASCAGTRRPEVQMGFCIDIRSEPLRHALETLTPTVETHAFAGFFGLPIAYQPLGTKLRRPQLPGLAFPEVDVDDVIIPVVGTSVKADSVIETRHHRLADRDQWHNTIRWANTTFSFVEAVGFGYLDRIRHWLRPSTKPRHNDDQSGLTPVQKLAARPRLVNVPLAQKAALASDALKVMGIGQRLAPLVVLTGHVSQSRNNAHASTLDCGACGGQSGEANVRALAALLNESDVREALTCAHGIRIPADTWFMPALHNTATDEITGFEIDLLPEVQRERWRRLVPVLANAGDRVRRERAPTLWMSSEGNDVALLERFRRRANDGSETRPEWGLTTNAAFIIGPRELTRYDRFSRCYLHDYDSATDPDFSVLEKLMMGPLLVTHWLGWQYHASTADPLHYGAGNKVLHNVVGGRIGVFEGNGGDLRIGLPKQSLFDGATWRHEPLRQTTVIAAPREEIDKIIARHEVLQQVIDNGWMILWQYQTGRLMRRSSGHWAPIT